MPDPRENRTSQSQFRHGPGGREPLAPPGGDHIHYTPRHQGFGVVLSRPAATGVAGCDCWACRRGYVIDHSKLGRK